MTHEPTNPPQQPIADPLSRARIEINAARRAQLASRAPDSVIPDRERMRFLLDQGEAALEGLDLMDMPEAAGPWPRGHRPEGF